MKTAALQQMQSLRNIGPRCAEQLIAAGIDTPQKLRALGAEEAFLRLVGHHGGMICFNACYLYALEGAITDTDWREISEQKKTAFKQFTKDLRESFKR